MLIPSAFRKLPNEAGCYNGQLVMGGNVAQMASALAQLSHCKFLGEAHYHIGQQILPGIGGMISFGYGISGTIKANYNYNFLYQSSPLSSHLAIIIFYRASNFESTTVKIDIELRATFSNSYTGAVLDYGIRFEEGVDLDHDRDNLSMAFSGTTLIDQPSNTTPEPPRPLFVPSANRGELLNVKVTTNQLLPATIHIYDILVPEVTP